MIEWDGILVLVDLCSRNFDYFRPKLRLTRHQFRKLPRTPAHRVCPQLLQPCRRRRRINRFLCCAVQRRDDHLRCFRRGEDAVPGIRGVAGHAFADGRDVGGCLRAFAAGQAQRAQAAVLDEGQYRQQAVHRQLDLAADRVDARGGAAFVRHMDDVDAGHLFEQFHVEVGRRAGAGGAVGQFARAGLGHRDQFFQVFRRQRGVGDDDLVGVGDVDDRLEIPDRVVGLAGVQRRVDDVGWADVDQGVAVGHGAGDGLGADQATGAGTVVDDDVGAEDPAHFLADRARQGVAGAAGGQRHDHADDFARVGLRAGKCGGEGESEQAAPDGSQDGFQMISGLV